MILSIDCVEYGSERKLEQTASAARLGEAVILSIDCVEYGSKRKLEQTASAARLGESGYNNYRILVIWCETHCC